MPIHALTTQYSTDICILLKYAVAYKKQPYQVDLLNSKVYGVIMVKSILALPHRYDELKLRHSYYSPALLG